MKKQIALTGAALLAVLVGCGQSTPQAPPALGIATQFGQAEQEVALASLAAAEARAADIRALLNDARAGNDNAVNGLNNNLADLVAALNTNIGSLTNEDYAALRLDFVARLHALAATLDGIAEDLVTASINNPDLRALAIQVVTKNAETVTTLENTVGGAICSDQELAYCSPTCVDTQTDEANCGACAHACPYLYTNTCCGGVCADVLYDNANCGACGNACSSDEACVAGTCVSAGPGCPCEFGPQNFTSMSSHPTFLECGYVTAEGYHRGYGVYTTWRYCVGAQTTVYDLSDGEIAACVRALGQACIF